MTGGAYTWDNAMVEGRRRLALLEHALDPATVRLFEAIGVGPGWRCLEVGAGGGSMTEWLADRVGPRGRVCAMDLDARFVRALGRANVDVREESVVGASLPEAAFDLVHARWTLMHIPERERVLAKLAAALRPGGRLFVEDSDALPAESLDRTPWHDVTMRVLRVVEPRGTHPRWARDVPFKLAALGLGDVRAEATFPYFHGASELAEFWKISWGHVRAGAAAAGVDVSAWDAELAVLDDPTRLFVGPMTVSTVATKE
jgi:SAM-dependent methyltransferase